MIPFALPETSPSPILLKWRNLTYTIKQTKWSVDNGYKIEVHTEEKTILQQQSGELRGGTITALMGPSGAGKSTLLSCITGRYLSGVQGDIHVQYPAEKKKVTIAFVPQKDYLFPQFTVKETLIFASRMKNKDPTDHEVKALKVMEDLNLQCPDVRISGCSGGQIKRVSIGVELISGPNILVLDEPTSGLDSTNAIKCIRLLKELALKHKDVDAPAIVATIHQPNSIIYGIFDQIYLLSRQGHNIYSGSPEGLVTHFAHHNLPQTKDSSAADFAIEVASGDNENIFIELAKRAPPALTGVSVDANANTRKTLDNQKTMSIAKIVHKMRSKRPKSGLTQMYLLMWRSIQASCFKSSQLLFKILVNIVIALLISLLWADPTGTEDGCWANSDIRKDILDGKYSADAVKLSPREAYLDKITKITANCNLLFSTCVYLILVYSIGTVLVIPLEIATVSKEMSNSWYNLRSYFAAKTLSDLPAVLLSILSLESVCWLATKQILDPWRFTSVFTLSVLMGLICESVGVMIGIMLAGDLVSATLVTMAASFPVLMFGGFLIKIADIPWYFKPMTYISYTRYTFEGILASIYGYGRCKLGTIDTVDFVQELTSAQNPIEVVTTIVNSFNVTSADAKLYAPLIGVPDEHLESVINGTLDYLGITPGAPSTTSDDLVDDRSLKSSSASYVMSYFKLGDNVLNDSFLSLTLILVAIKLLIFYLLSWRTRHH